jgi:hypothetical protein
MNKVLMAVAILFGSTPSVSLAMSSVEDSGVSVDSEQSKKAISKLSATKFSSEEIKILTDALEDILVDEESDDTSSSNKDKPSKAKVSNKKLKKAGSEASKKMPHGLAKREGDLPKGLAMQLEKNGHLPPGLEKRELPDEVSSQLPVRIKGQDIVIVEDDVVLVDTVTNTVLDILKDVVGNKK